MKAKGAVPDWRSVSRRLPLIFGVSGHRDLLIKDLPQLRNQIRKIFARFRKAYPQTPFLLVTPLAEGADRLAAEVALASGIGLLVPLPMAQREYERDFNTVESLAEFRALLAVAESHWEIPMAANSGNKSRTGQYAEVGDLIARHSHVLLLLWDGRDNRKVGGTAWVRKRRERWVDATSSPLHSITSLVYGPTIQVVTPRASGHLPRPRPATIGELPPSAAQFTVTLSKRASSKRAGNRQEGLPSYQLAYWALNSFNANVPNVDLAKNRKKRQSARRSRL